MSSNQNKLVKTKFQNASNCVVIMSNRHITTPPPVVLVSPTNVASISKLSCGPIKCNILKSSLAMSSKQLFTSEKSKKKLPSSTPAATSAPIMKPVAPTGAASGVNTVVKPGAKTEARTGAVRNQTAKSLDSPSVTRKRISSATLPKTPSMCYASSSRIYRPNRSQNFDYDLSKDEQRDFSKSPKPMKKVPAHELQLLRDGQRTTYLETRYDQTPDVKYNYPEATSWRYGWFQSKSFKH